MRAEEGDMVERRSAERFTYLEATVDAEAHSITCHYALDGEQFTEIFTIDADGTWSGPAFDAALRWLFLFAGISYYKTAAPMVIDTGATALTEDERDFLRTYFIDGLGEFAYRAGLDLSDIVIDGATLDHRLPVDPAPTTSGPLVPFGGGIDSIVTVEGVRAAGHVPTLFIANRPNDTFAAIEDPAKATGLSILRATRSLDHKVLESAARGYLNGHVPITAVLSALAVLSGVVGGHECVVMSNEHSASAGNVEIDGRGINHQWSKSEAFERGFAAVLTTSISGGPAYFSALRNRSELWVAKRFSELSRYHLRFRSCNKAFHQDPARRFATWCGVCDKCCFIDLILSPYLERDELDAIFSGNEPLENPDLIEQFRTLVGLGASDKPFECVGDERECRAAATLASRRSDRADNVTLFALVDTFGALDDAVIARLVDPIGWDGIPPGFLTTR